MGKRHINPYIIIYLFNGLIMALCICHYHNKDQTLCKECDVSQSSFDCLAFGNGLILAFPYCSFKMCVGASVIITKTGSN